MKVLFQTSQNKLRQDAQAVIKKDLESLGVEVELKAVIAEYFSLETPKSRHPVAFLRRSADVCPAAWRPRRCNAVPAGISLIRDFSEVQQVGEINYSRYVSKEFDALHEVASRELDPMKFGRP